MRYIATLLTVVWMAYSADASYRLDSSTTTTSCNGTLSISNNIIGDELTFTPPLDCPIGQSIDVVLLGTNNSIISHATTRKLKLPAQCLSLLTMLVTVGKTSYARDDSSNATVLCNDSALYTQIGFNCTATPILWPILYQPTNCLVSSVSTPVNQQQEELERHSPLCWYARCLNDSLASNATLCGEPVCTILYRSDLYLNQCGTSGDHEMTPWYQMAVQLVTYALNYGNKATYTYVWWKLGTEILERHCDARREVLSSVETLDKSSFYRRFLAQMQRDNEAPLDMPCDEIREYFERLYNKTVSEALYSQWYYTVFKSVLMPDSDMEIRAIVLVSFLCILPFVLLAFLFYCIRGLRRNNRPRKVHIVI